MIPQLYTLDQQLACVRRELSMRKAVYPKWVGSGRMKSETAHHELGCMEAVLDTLTRLKTQV
jgi:hypothetical protein